MRGFTLIEVMVAMLIFTLAAVVSVDLVKGSVRSTVRTRRITEATWLLQNIMTELETKMETLGFQQGCEEKVEAAFEEPYSDYSWTTSCTEIDFQLSQTMAQLAEQQQSGEDDPLTENAMLAQILKIVNDHLTQAARELHAEVRWREGNTERVISLTTHVVDFTRKMQVPTL